MGTKINSNIDKKENSLNYTYTKDLVHNVSDSTVDDILKSVHLYTVNYTHHLMIIIKGPVNIPSNILYNKYRFANIPKYTVDASSWVNPIHGIMNNTLKIVGFVETYWDSNFPDNNTIYLRFSESGQYDMSVYQIIVY